MILQYGNLTLLSVEELNGGMFPKAQHYDGVKIYGEDKWKLHSSDFKIFGINIEVPDIYPILKYPEARRKAKRSAGYIKVNEQAMLNTPPPVPSILEPETSHDIVDGSPDPSYTGYLPHSNNSSAKEVLKLSDLDEMIEKLRVKRSNLHQPVGLHAGPLLISSNADTDDTNGGGVANGVGEDAPRDDGTLKPGLIRSTGSIRRARSSER